ncbi:MAG: glycosyltransferase family 2 protein, partial [Vulcanimicrobiaceae bacterium]
MIPAYRAAEAVGDVVAGVLPFVDHVIVVDDACTQESGLLVEARFSGDPRVEVLRHQGNRGVGAAMKTGFHRALYLGADIVLKVDADGQMDPRYISQMVRILEANPRISLVKGNRFFDSAVTRLMPGLRLLGNSALTFLVRLTSGYWNGIDPTNGFFAISGRALRRIKIDRLADRYFFEISLLVELGMRRGQIAEIEMPARYDAATSSLSIGRTLVTFPGRLFSAFCRRVFWQYIVSDMNVGSLFLGIGLPLLAFGLLAGVMLETQS